MARNVDAFMVVCRCFSVVTAVAALLCIAVNVLYAVRSFMNESDIFDGIFRCYAVLIAIFVVVAETEWDVVMKFWKVLEYWVARGILQIFVAVMTKAYSEDSDDQTVLVLLENIASYMLLACGVVYVVSGIFCVGYVKRAHQKKEVPRDQAIKDLQELEQRRQELEALLLVQERA
ncbi:uncharacterized protein LOC131307856 [Rhododendron vialii]|uniref:uncharacterized protein LOC131307856 n=1 Tax=Rhododendron vialii TaxID=182163 RepID=UPI00265EFF6B|nr:uncharacterized protein LOC131307856 [Rhododendron vialii]XP_058190563.1 uncharacterized protein LOC131307856 [Rhododendron vialii]